MGRDGERNQSVTLRDADIGHSARITVYRQSHDGPVDGNPLPGQRRH